MSSLAPRPALVDDDLDELDTRHGVTPLHWLLLALGAAWRRKVVAVGVFAIAVGSVVAYYSSRTPQYRVETKILAQRQNALPSVVRAAYDEQPTRSVWETVHRRENLVALVRQARLVPADAAAAGERPRGADPGSGVGAEAGPEDDLVRLLDRRLSVTADAGTITISLDWADPRVAYDIVEAALRNFLEARHVQEITAIDEVLSVLQGRAAALRKTLDDAIEDARRRAPRSAPVAAPRVRVPSEELARLQSLLEAKQRAVRDVEELRLRRVAEIQAQIDSARNTLSDAHPTVIGLRKELEAGSRESPLVQTLRDDERKLRKEYSDRLRQEGFHGAVAPAAAQLPPPPVPATSEEDDPAVRQARLQYEQVAARVNMAQVELDAVRAAFKYRYEVIWPPEFPTEPVSPNPLKIFGAGVLAALLLAFGAAVAPDLWAGRIVQRWQLERALDLPILGEVRRRS